MCYMLQVIGLVSKYLKTNNKQQTTSDKRPITFSPPSPTQKNNGMIILMKQFITLPSLKKIKPKTHKNIGLGSQLSIEALSNLPNDLSVEIIEGREERL